MKRRAFDSRLYAFTADRLNSSNRTYKAYVLLLQLVPQLKEMLEDSSVDTVAFNHFIAQVRCHLDIRVSLSLNTSKLQKGANDARSDDVRRVKEEVANWINQSLSPTTPFSLKHRDDRGLQNDITGRLLCPIELSWDDDEYAIINACHLNTLYCL
jgi:hypothetical protein